MGSAAKRISALYISQSKLNLFVQGQLVCKGYDINVLFNNAIVVQMGYTLQ